MAENEQSYLSTEPFSTYTSTSSAWSVLLRIENNVSGSYARRDSDCFAEQSQIEDYMKNMSEILNLHFYNSSWKRFIAKVLSGNCGPFDALVK